jgi:hypothetical protein
MSEIFLKFISPNIIAHGYGAGQKGLRSIINFGIIVWDTVIITDSPKDKVTPILRKNMKVVLEKMISEDPIDVVQKLVDRKRKLFPHVRRKILSFKLTGNDGKYHLSTVSTGNLNDLTEI